MWRTRRRRRTCRSSSYMTHERHLNQRPVSLVKPLRIFAADEEKKKVEWSYLFPARRTLTSTMNNKLLQSRNITSAPPMTFLERRYGTQAKFLGWWITTYEDESERICSTNVKWTNWDRPVAVACLDIDVRCKSSRPLCPASDVCASGKDSENVPRVVYEDMVNESGDEGTTSTADCSVEGKSWNLRSLDVRDRTCTIGQMPLTCRELEIRGEKTETVAQYRTSHQVCKIEWCHIHRITGRRLERSQVVRKSLRWRMIPWSVCIPV